MGIGPINPATGFLVKHFESDAAESDDDAKIDDNDGKICDHCFSALDDYRNSCEFCNKVICVRCVRSSREAGKKVSTEYCNKCESFQGGRICETCGRKIRLIPCCVGCYTALTNALKNKIQIGVPDVEFVWKCSGIF